MHRRGIEYMVNDRVKVFEVLFGLGTASDGAMTVML